MKRIIPALALIGLLLTGCSPWTGSGTVTNKDHRGAYSYSTVILAGKVPVPQTHYVPECYKLTIQDSTDGKEHDLCFDQAIWDQYQIGSRITVEDNQ